MKVQNDVFVAEVDNEGKILQIEFACNPGVLIDLRELNHSDIEFIQDETTGSVYFKFSAAPDVAQKITDSFPPERIINVIDHTVQVDGGSKITQCNQKLLDLSFLHPIFK